MYNQEGSTGHKGILQSRHQRSAEEVASRRGTPEGFDMSKSIGAKAADSLQHCRVVASHIPSIQPGEEMKAGDEWIRYKEMNMIEDDQSLHVDNFWKKCSPRKITVEISLKCCQNGQICFNTVPFKCRC